MPTIESISTVPLSDSDLVARSVSGDRAAFGEIVSRYQNLICSLAYSATGSFNLSEELAQETFIAAWKSLSNLDEPMALRGWLCGVLRNVIRAQRRKFRPSEPADETHPSTDPSPVERAISEEEQTILWSTLSRIPEKYRRPLVLYYRQEQSVRQVAEELNLSEDAVKKRLSRGRKLLRNEVLGLMEGVLRRSSPGKAFTLGVIAALPFMAVSARAATISGAAVKGSVLAKSAGLVGIFNFLLGPLIGLWGGYIGVRAGLDSARTPRERQFILRHIRKFLIAVLGADLLIAILVFIAVSFWNVHPVLMATLGIVLPAALAIGLVVWSVRYSLELLRLRQRERQLNPQAYQDTAAMRVIEWRSQRTLLGLPLIHVRLGSPSVEELRWAAGWIAIGDKAMGILLAAGGISIGGVSFGGLSFGLLSFGGVSAGGAALGGLAIAALAIGGMAVGSIAAGGLAAGIKLAVGGLAVARDYAVGGLAQATHANDPAARAMLAAHTWLDFRNMSHINVLVVACWLPMLVVLPLLRRLNKRPK